MAARRSHRFLDAAVAAPPIDGDASPPPHRAARSAARKRAPPKPGARGGKRRRADGGAGDAVAEAAAAAAAGGAGKGAALRDSVRAGLQSALAEGLAAAATQRAGEIEAALFSAYGESARYRAEARELVSNLRDARNAGLRAEVLGGALSAARLVRMDSAELAWPERRAERREIEREDVAERTAREEGLVEVADRVCPACGAASALRGEVRRVEAGKSDTWGAKDAPDAVERLRCRACGHSWEHEE